LVKEHVIFKYVTDYVLANPTIDSAGTYEFDQYEAFVKFAKNSGFKFESESDKLVKKLEASLDKNGLGGDTNQALQTITATLDTDQADDYQQFKEEIIQLIEKDIITRYYYQRGKILNQLNGDPEVTEAISIMRDASRYNSILQPK